MLVGRGKKKQEIKERETKNKLQSQVRMFPQVSFDQKVWDTRGRRKYERQYGVPLYVHKKKRWERQVLLGARDVCFFCCYLRRSLKDTVMSYIGYELFIYLHIDAHYV